MTQTRATDEQVPAFDVHDRCRKAREWAELDQEALAEKMGVSRSTVSNYETGATKNVRRIVLKAWADATGVPFEWLTGEDTRWYLESPTDLREPCAA